MQTHLAENRDEVRWVHELFPEARSYLDVYARAGLLHARSVFAHGIWLDDADRAALHARRRADRAQPVVEPVPRQRPVRLARRRGGRRRRSASRSDVGGGTSLSMLRNCADAYKVQAMAGQRLTAWKALHAATRGAARALGLGHEIGSLDVGCAGRRLRLGLGRRPGRAAARGACTRFA